MVYIYVVNSSCYKIILYEFFSFVKTKKASCIKLIISLLSIFDARVYSSSNQSNTITFGASYEVYHKSKVEIKDKDINFPRF
jgi:hypothetical protein